ncbi:MAG: hypothetical protein IPG08_11025 [Sphingobacteriaceae bacterium]|nr:hypothetical protein [Sphingobacteriaceae bacterium]
MPLVKSSNNNKEAQFKILTAISYLKDQFGIDRTLQLIGLSKQLYHQWALEARLNALIHIQSYAPSAIPNNSNSRKLKK